MKTKNNREIKRIYILLAFIALSVAMSGCGGGATSNNAAATPNVNRDTPNTQAQQTPTPNPADALAGVWETKDPRATGPSTATTQFVRWQISSATKRGEEYVGKVSDLSNNNLDVADYVLRPNNSVTLEFKGSYITGAPSSTYNYEVSDNGNTITLKGDKPIVLTRGSTNTDIQKDAQTIASTPPDWKLDPDVALKMFPTFNKDYIFVVFAQPSKYNEGYGGTMEFHESYTTPQKVAEWRYTITSRNKVDVNDGKGTKSASYELLNNDKILKIDFADDTPDLYLTR